MNAPLASTVSLLSYVTAQNKYFSVEDEKLMRVCDVSIQLMLYENIQIAKEQGVCLIYCLFTHSVVVVVQKLLKKARASAAEVGVA